MYTQKVSSPFFTSAHSPHTLEVDDGRRRRLTTFKPADIAELRTAMNAWCSDEAGATANYGPVESWDTSLITDMSYLLSQLQCNPPIGDWDTGAVTTMR